MTVWFAHRQPRSRSFPRGDLMTNSLEGYAVLKIAGKGQGLESLRQMLSARFSRGKRAAANATQPEPA
jgi:hypothetical protein